MPIKFNHADLFSKPLHSKEYIDNKLGTTGPSFLQQENNDWLDLYKWVSVIKKKIPET